MSSTLSRNRDSPTGLAASVCHLDCRVGLPDPAALLPAHQMLQELVPLNQSPVKVGIKRHQCVGSGGEAGEIAGSAERCGNPRARQSR